MTRLAHLAAILLICLLVVGTLSCETDLAPPRDISTAPATAPPQPETLTPIPPTAATPQTEAVTAIPPSTTPAPHPATETPAPIPAPATGPTPTAVPQTASPPECQLLDFSWCHDGLPRRELKAAEGLENIHEKHPHIAEEILSFQWVGGTHLGGAQMDALGFFASISEQDGPLLERLVALPWFRHGFPSERGESSGGAYAVGCIVQIKQLDNLLESSMAQQLVGFPWFADSITEDEEVFLCNLWELVNKDRSLAAAMTELLASSTQIADGITDEDLWFLKEVANAGEPGITPEALRVTLGQAHTPGPKPPRNANRVEWEALVALYHATGGPNWHDNENWLSDEPLLRWYGVGTDASRVSALDLSDNGLTGELPPELGNLNNLGALRLAGNQLTGCIPHSLRAALARHRAGDANSVDFGDLNYCEGSAVFGLPWLRGERLRLSADDYDVVRALESLEREHPATAQLVLGYPWVQDGVASWERDTLIAYPGLEHAFLDLPWVQDGVTLTERKAMDSLQSLQREHPAIAKVVLEYPWLDDGVDADESYAIESISYLAEIDQSVAQSVLDSPWVADGLGRSFANSEGWAMFYLRILAAKDASLAKRLLELPWVMDGILNEAAPIVALDEEPEAPASAYAFWATNDMWISTFSGTRLDTPKNWSPAIDSGFATNIGPGLAEIDPSLANRFFDFPWFADGLTPSEALAIEYIKLTGDPALARRLSDMPWLEDGVTSYERGTVANMWSLLRQDIELANDLANSSFFDGEFRRGLHWGAVDVLQAELTGERSREQSWVRDGLTEEEAAKLVLLRNSAIYPNVNERLFQSTLSGGHVESEELSLPSAGDVKLFVFSRSPLQTKNATFGQLRLGVATIADFVEEPWPVRDIIVHLEPEMEYDDAGDINGRYHTSHISVKVPAADPNFTETLYHELAHYYFSSANLPLWLSEGTAEFLSSHVLHTGENHDLQYRVDRAQKGVEQYCTPNGITNIHQLYEAVTEVPLPCYYLIGESFLWEMYNSLGSETVSSALREMYRMTAVRGWGLNEEEIYEVFLSSTPPEKQDEFRNLYSRLHGRPYEDTTAQDRAALVALYNATDGENWLNNENWLTEAPIYEWHGVITDSRRGRVVRLDLAGNRLAGPMPPELGNLTYLGHLDLHGNQLNGSIAPEIGRLRWLKTLQFDNNRLTGPIPPEIGNLSVLHHLSLSGNRLSGSIPPELGSMPNLRGLFLQSNQLTGVVPAELGDIPKLDYLNLSHSQLTGCIPGRIYDHLTRGQTGGEVDLYQWDYMVGLSRC